VGRPGLEPGTYGLKGQEHILKYEPLSAGLLRDEPIPVRAVNVLHRVDRPGRVSDAELSASATSPFGVALLAPDWPAELPRPIAVAGRRVELKERAS